MFNVPPATYVLLRCPSLYFLFLWSAAEDACPNPDNIAASRKCCLEIARHSHAQQQRAVFSPLALLRGERLFENIPSLLELLKVFIRFLRRVKRLGERSDGHEALKVQIGARRDDVLRYLDELGLGRGWGRREGRQPGLRVLTRRIDLKEHVERGRSRIKLLVKRVCALDRRNCLDSVQVRNRWAEIRCLEGSERDGD